MKSWAVSLRRRVGGAFGPFSPSNDIQSLQLLLALSSWLLNFPFVTSSTSLWPATVSLSSLFSHASLLVVLRLVFLFFVFTDFVLNFGSSASRSLPWAATQLPFCSTSRALARGALASSGQLLELLFVFMLRGSRAALGQAQRHAVVQLHADCLLSTSCVLDAAQELSVLVLGAAVCESAEVKSLRCAYL